MTGHCDWFEERYQHFITAIENQIKLQSLVQFDHFTGWRSSFSRDSGCVVLIELRRAEKVSAVEFKDAYCQNCSGCNCDISSFWGLGMSRTWVLCFVLSLRTDAVFDHIFLCFREWGLFSKKSGNSWSGSSDLSSWLWKWIAACLPCASRSESKPGRWFVTGFMRAGALGEFATSSLSNQWMNVRFWADWRFIFKKSSNVFKLALEGTTLVGLKRCFKISNLTSLVLAFHALVCKGKGVTSTLKNSHPLKLLKVFESEHTLRRNFELWQNLWRGGQDQDSFYHGASLVETP